MTYIKELRSLAKEGSLIKKYLERQEELKPLISDFPDLHSFENQFKIKK